MSDGDLKKCGNGYQVLENLATAYWQSQVLFTAIELKLFSLIEAGFNSIEALAGQAFCKPGELARFIKALEALELVSCENGKVINTRAASSYLVDGAPEYMGDFFLYRQYFRPQWEGLTQKVSAREKEPEPELSYPDRTLKYVAAMDTLVRKKAEEIAGILNSEGVHGHLLDVGGGAGSLARVLLEETGISQAMVFDIPEVICAAEKLYPDPGDWESIFPVGGDFRSHRFREIFSLVCMSNFLHVYGPEEANALLQKGISLLGEAGILMVHDYFPDRSGSVPEKGALYDVNMMLNTYNGVCHDASVLIQWCKDSGMSLHRIKDLQTDTAVILLKKVPPLPDQYKG